MQVADENDGGDREAVDYVFGFLVVPDVMLTHIVVAALA
jgi:hypothetical protein